MCIIERVGKMLKEIIIKRIDHIIIEVEVEIEQQEIIETKENIGIDQDQRKNIIIMRDKIIDLEVIKSK